MGIALLQSWAVKHIFSRLVLWLTIQIFWNLFQGGPQRLADLGVGNQKKQSYQHDLPRENYKLHLSRYKEKVLHWQWLLCLPHWNRQILGAFPHLCCEYSSSIKLHLPPSQACSPKGCSVQWHGKTTFRCYKATLSVVGFHEATAIDNPGSKSAGL